MKITTTLTLKYLTKNKKRTLGTIIRSNNSRNIYYSNSNNTFNIPKIQRKRNKR